ncbi:MAG: hypothetical protein AB7O21_16075 [Gammaproteobacteria bacterium]
MTTHTENCPSHAARRTVGRVSPDTLARWALVRQIAELEEMLADNACGMDGDVPHLWIEQARQTLAAKRAVLRMI